MPLLLKKSRLLSVLGGFLQGENRRGRNVFVDYDGGRRNAGLLRPVRDDAIRGLYAGNLPGMLERQGARRADFNEIGCRANLRFDAENRVGLVADALPFQGVDARAEPFHRETGGRDGRGVIFGRVARIQAEAGFEGGRHGGIGLKAAGEGANVGGQVFGRDSFSDDSGFQIAFRRLHVPDGGGKTALQTGQRRHVRGGNGERGHVGADDADKIVDPKLHRPLAAGNVIVTHGFPLSAPAGNFCGVRVASAGKRAVFKDKCVLKAGKRAAFIGRRAVFYGKRAMKVEKHAVSAYRFHAVPLRRSSKRIIARAAVPLYPPSEKTCKISRCPSIFTLSFGVACGKMTVSERLLPTLTGDKDMILHRLNFQRMACLPFLCVLYLALLGVGTHAAAQIAISGVSLSPASLSPLLNDLTITATVTSVNSGLSVYAQLYEDGKPYIWPSAYGNTLATNLSNGGSGNVYTGGFYNAPYYPAGIPANRSTTQAHTWTVIITATDSVGNKATVSQSVTQVADVPPSISNIVLSPTALSPLASDLTVTATITPGNSGFYAGGGYTLIQSAQLYKDGQPYPVNSNGSLDAIGLYNGGSGNIYSGSFVNALYSPYGIPANFSITQSHVWTVAVTSIDGLGNQTTVFSQPITQSADVPATISNIILSPATLPAIASDLNVAATITPGNSGFYAGGGYTLIQSAQLYKDGQPYPLNSYGYSDIIGLYNGGNGNVYTGRFNNSFPNPAGIPANISTTQAHVWTVVVTSLDGLSNPATASQSVIQPPDVPPAISNATISPAILLKTGDTLNVRATVIPGSTGSAPVNTVTAELDKDGQPYRTNVTLYSNFGNVYTGAFAIPANPDHNTGHAWTVILTATDTFGNASQTTVGPSVQLTDDQLTIAYAALTPAALPATGGTLIVDALGADPSNITSLVVNVYKDGQFYTSDSAGSGPGQLVNYEGRFTIPANPDIVSHHWSAVVTFTAGDGETVSRSIGPSVQAVASFVSVSGQIALDGVPDLRQILVPVGAITFEFRAPGTTAALFTKTATLTTDAANPGLGDYTLTGVTPGTYDIAIKSRNSLRAVVKNAKVTGSAGTISAVLLLGGDANGDNSVDSSDFGILIGAFNSDSSVIGSGYDPAADFNYDGFVDSSDFGILIGNYNLTGDL